jgi:hypothetical protein
VHISIYLSLNFIQIIFIKRRWRYKYDESVPPKFFLMGYISFAGITE